MIHVKNMFLLMFDNKEIDIRYEFGRKMLDRIRSDHFTSVDKERKGIGTGHILAKAYIENYGTCDGVFYSRIGTEVEKKYENGKYIKNIVEIQSDILNNIKDAVISAKKENKPTATLFISCRYIGSNGNEHGHNICLSVNANRFGNLGNIIGEQKLGPDDCQIFDTSGAVTDNINNAIFYNIKKQFDKFIDTSKIGEYCYFNNKQDFKQVGPRCSDYSSIIYLNLNDWTSDFSKMNILDLKKEKSNFQLHISKNILYYYRKAKEENIKRSKSKGLRHGVNLMYTKEIINELDSENRELEKITGQVKKELSSQDKDRIRLKSTNKTIKNSGSEDEKLDIENNSILKSLNFRSKFNPYVRSSHFSPTKLSKKITSTDHGRYF